MVALGGLVEEDDNNLLGKGRGSNESFPRRERRPDAKNDGKEVQLKRMDAAKETRYGQTDLRDDGNFLAQVLQPDTRDVYPIDGDTSTRELRETQEAHPKSALS